MCLHRVLRREDRQPFADACFLQIGLFTAKQEGKKHHYHSANDAKEDKAIRERTENLAQPAADNVAEYRGKA